MLGCHGGATTPWHRGERWETDTCPRRLLLREPVLVDLLRLHRDTDGRVGLEGLRTLSAHAVEGIDIISAARAWRSQKAAEQEAARDDGRRQVPAHPRRRRV